ncbi:MAG: hypothetical protein AAGD13_16195 [Pseudomonadota bacterium]
MSTAGESVSLDSFLADAEPRIRERIGEGVRSVRDVCGLMGRALDAEPELRRQVDRLRDLVSEDMIDQPHGARRAIAHDASALRGDIKRRWIDADAPPMVGEVDDHLAALSKAITGLTVGDADYLRGVARKIDALSAQAARFDGIERKFIPWAIGAGVLFLLGMALLMVPGLFGNTVRSLSMGPILLCFTALPVLGGVYAARVMPRTKADAEIEALNREHFLPLGGVYFAAGERPACVVQVNLQPDQDGSGGLVQPDPREVTGRAWRLW